MAEISCVNILYCYRMSYANPFVLYTFDSNGTNSGSGGATYNITNGTTTISSSNKLKGSGALSVPLNTPAGAGVPIMTYNTGTTGITISFWIKFSSTATGNRFIYTSKALSQAASSAVNLMDSLWVNGTNSIVYYSKGSITERTVSGATYYTDNNWHHFVVVYNGGASDPAGKIYVDNSLISFTNRINIGNNIDQQLWIGGCYYGPGSNDFGADGNIDDFRIYNYVADATFVSYLYKLGSNTNIASLSSVAVADLNAAGASVDQLISMGKPVPDLLAAGATVSQLLAAGVPFSQLVNYAQWLDLSATSNIFNRTYVNSFIDLSGSLLIRNNGALTVGGDTSFNYVTLNGTKYVANDLAVTSNLFIGNDISINGNLSVGGDVSINNQFSGNFANNLIPTTAIENYPSGGSNVAISGNVRIAGDVSFNGTTVDLSTNTVLQVDDYITFNDGSIMARHDDLKSRMFDMSASSVTTTTVTGVAQGQRILCSSDGKYVAINMGGATYQAGNDTQSSTGIDISQDYGATFTRKYLNNPTDGTTPLYRPYPCLSISLTGQFMICCSYGATGHNVSDNVIGFSNNYGATWSTAYLKDLIGTGTEVMYIRGVAISSDGTTMIIDVFRSDNMHMYKTTSKSLSGFTLISNRGSAYFAENTLKLIQAGGVEYIVAQSLDNQDKGRLVIYYLSSGTNLHTSTINYGGNTDISIPFNAINCIITGPAGQISRVDCREDFVYNQPNITDISNNYSPATTRMSSVQSPLGKHILIGPFINSSYNSPNITDATRLRYSTNGGYRFKTVSGLVSNTFTAIKSVALSDRGHMYIVDDIGSGNLKYVAAKFELMRDVTFKSVVVNGQATVAGTTTTSDYRIKENVSNLNNNDTIDDLVPIQYNNILSGKHEFGLFAHELQSIYPELVEGEKDGAEYQRVDYNGLIGVLVKEVQDLKKRVAVIKK